jgi:peptidase M42 family hydrolase
MQKDAPLPPVNTDYLRCVLTQLLAIPSPTGFTDAAVRFTCEELDTLGVAYELTRRGAIRGTIAGRRTTPDRAIVTHLDTLGAMVRTLKDNGRLAITMIGTWAARFAEGARVTIYTDAGRAVRGTILPLKASGHTFGDACDTQPATWDNLEIRVDERVHDAAGLEALGIAIGDFVAVDTEPEFTDSGFIKARHLDNKAGVAAKMAAIKAVVDAGCDLPVDCHPLFTITEEEGTGASSVLHGDVASLIAVDNSTVAPGQASREDAVTIAMRDRGGIYDYHLTRQVIALCREHDIPFARDIFRHYRSDAVSALSAGNDIRTALVCFGLDASHGWERTHIDSLEATARLLVAYMLSERDIAHDAGLLGPLDTLPASPVCGVAFGGKQEQT